MRGRKGVLGLNKGIREGILSAKEKNRFYEDV